MRLECTASVAGVTVVRIFDAPKLDPINLILRDDGGCGQVIVECYGEAWATYFGAIGPVPLMHFLSGCHPEYLATRMARQRRSKSDSAYLLRICEAVVIACQPQTPTGADHDGQR